MLEGMTTIRLVSLTKDYPKRRALNDVSFTIPPGEIFGFVGSNGAGKTTTMRIMLGVTAPTSGEVLVDEEPVSAQMRSRFGYMPEERGLYPRMKVHEQLVYLARLHGMSKAEADRNASQWEDKLAIGHYRDDLVEALSLGNQQRVQLASALTHNPVALVLDEPFSGLDPLAVEAMSQALREKANEGVPVLFSSHQLELVEKLCDRVGILSQGTLVACGTIDELRAQAQAQTEFSGSAQALDAVRQRAGELALAVREDEGTVRVDGAPTDPPVAELARAGLATGGLTSFGAYHEPLSLMYRNVVSVDTPEPQTPATPTRRWWKKGGRR